MKIALINMCVHLDMGGMLGYIFLSLNTRYMPFEVSPHPTLWFKQLIRNAVNSGV